MAGETVLIACKAPNGLILNLDSYKVSDERSNAVQRIDGGATVTLKGWSTEIGRPNLTLETGGYALTEVPADFWAAWFERNKESSLLHDKIILPPHRDAVGKAREHRDIPQMHAKALPVGDPRLPKVDQDRLAPDRAAA